MSNLTELPGKEHWWWDTASDSDGGAMNDDEMRRFFSAALGPPRARAALPPMPWELSDGGRGSYTLTAHGPAAFTGRRGWRILQSATPGLLSSVRVAADVLIR